MSESALPGEGGFPLPWPAGGSEERLARRAAAGDERAFAAIFRRYGPELHHYCLAILGNGADAQDALQNVMVKALRSLPGERREIKLKPWLYRVAHNESVELLRRRQQGEELDPEAAAPDVGLAETTAQRQRLRHLLADLEQLPERQRGALLMRELSGLDFEQIGSALDISAPAARQTVYEARLGLREMEAGREMSCDLVTKAVSDGDGRVLRRRDVRAHLRACPECRAFRAGIEDRRHDLAAIAPLPALAVAALLKGAVGASAGAGGGGAAAGAGTAAAGASGPAAAGAGGSAGIAGGLGAGGGLAKAVATVAVVAVVGAGAADRAGLVQIGDSGDGTPAASRAAGGGGAAGAKGARTGPRAHLLGAKRAAREGGRNAALPRVKGAAAAARSATPAISAPLARQAGDGQGEEAGPEELGAHGRGKGPQGKAGAHGGGPPAHSHAGGNSASANANAGGNSASSHGNSGHGQRAAEHKATHGPGTSQAKGPKPGRHPSGNNGKSPSHAAAPPSSSPHQPAEPKAPQTEAPAAGAAESKPTPEANHGKAATDPESSS